VLRVSGAHLRCFAPWPTLCGCSGGESLATCERFDRIGIWTSCLPHQRHTSYSCAIWPVLCKGCLAIYLTSYLLSQSCKRAKILGIEMTINLPGHPMSVTQCYLAMNDTHFFRTVYSFCIIFKWLNVMFMFRPTLIMIVHVRSFWSAVLR